MEAAALKEATERKFIESREPMILCFDVLIQYLSTLAISDGFYPDEIFKEIKSTYCYRDITRRRMAADSALYNCRWQCIAAI